MAGRSLGQDRCPEERFRQPPHNQYAGDPTQARHAILRCATGFGSKMVSKMFTTRSRGASDMATTMIGLAVTLAFSLVAFTMPTSVWAAGPTLTVSADGGVHTFDRDELLARTDVVEITTSRDVAYRCVYRKFESA
jgi:hypothetical protein